MSFDDLTASETNLRGLKPLENAILPRAAIQPFVVTAEHMQQIEQRLFTAGMPVAALMEKVGGLIARWFLSCLANRNYADEADFNVGVLAGPGHNGGDALVVARELHLLGYTVKVYQPFSDCKSLTIQHASYAKSLGIVFVESVINLTECDAIIDGWFGFGLTRPITDSLAEDIHTLNRQNIPVFSLDLPSYRYRRGNGYCYRGELHGLSWPVEAGFCAGSGAALFGNVYFDRF